MEYCEDLETLSGPGDAEFKSAARGWISDYKVCKLKQKIIADCVDNFNKKATR